MLKQTLMLSNRKARRAARHSRIPRKDENQEGGATGGAAGTGGDNTQGNTSQQGNSGENQNNDGQPLDLASFWGTEGEEVQSPNSGSADGSSSSSTGNDPNQPTLAQRLGTQLDGMNFDPVMTPEIIEAMSNGDPAAFNTGMKSYGQQVAKQTLGMVVGILKDFREEVLGEARTHTSTSMNNQEDFRELVSAIPQADSKHVASKTIRDIYGQSLKNAKGNRKVAIEQTKQVLKLQAELFGGISGLTVAPQDTSGGNYQPPAKVNWLEELSGR